MFVDHPNSMTARRCRRLLWVGRVPSGMHHAPAGGIIMQLRYRLVLPLVAICCLAFAVTPALAAKTAPTVVQQNPTLHPSNETNAACQMGVLPPPGTAFGYILPPDDIYYTLLDPANCSACLPPAAAGRLMQVAHVLLYFTEPCQI